MDRITTTVLATIVAVGTACSAAGCQAASPLADPAPTPAVSRSVQVVNPADYEQELSAAAATCPVLTPARITTTIDTLSDWRLGQTNAMGNRGLTQFTDEHFARYTPAGSDPDDPRAAITAVAGHMCDIATRMSGPFRRGEVQVKDWTPTGKDIDNNAELVGLTMAGVLAGPQYVIDNGGASVRDPNLSAAMIRVMYA